MTQRVLIGTAFEYCQISFLAARLKNDIAALLQLADAASMPIADINQLSEVSNTLFKYWLEFTPSSLEKKLNP